MVKKSEIIAELEALGIEHDPTDIKPVLEDLLAEVETAAITSDEDTMAALVSAEGDLQAGRTATLHKGPTGLCTQCKRPADHSHIGV